MIRRFALPLGFLLAAAASAQTPMTGAFDHAGDIGQPALPGATAYDAATQTYTITGAGVNMWARRDEFQFAWTRLSGDFILTAEAAFEGEGVDPHRKLGWIVRSGLEADAPYVDVAVHGDGLTSMQYRRAAADTTAEVVSSLTAPDVIRLERKAGIYTMSVARRGEPFVSETLEGVHLGDDVLAGLFVCSHNPDVRETAVFRNVRVTIPAPDGFRPYQDYIGSRLETVDVETGQLFVSSSSTVIVVEVIEYPAPATIGYFTDPWGVGLSGPQGLPLFKPPYKRVTSLDLTTGNLAWMEPHGDGPRNHPALAALNLPPLGGGGGISSGPLVTPTLLIMNHGGRDYDDIAASSRTISAYDKSTGNHLGALDLPGVPGGNPVTYLHNGKQYLVVALGSGDSAELLALTLP